MFDLPAQSSSYMLGTRAAQEVLLELTLLDADITLPRDAYALKAAYGQGNAGGTGAGVPGSLSMRRGSVECSLLVLVSRAENLPTVLKWVAAPGAAGGAGVASATGSM